MEVTVQFGNAGSFFNFRILSMQVRFTLGLAPNAIAVLTSLGLAACGALHGSPCSPDQQRLTSETLYFGTATPTGTVTAEEWSAFLGESVTARFPQGLSVWPAAGQWRSADGSLTRDSSFVLNLVHPGDPAIDEAIRSIVAEYKARFRQEAVMRVKTDACVSF